MNVPNTPFVDEDFARFTVTPEMPMAEVLKLIDVNGEGVALVVDEDRRLAGIVTDGDIRRAILAGADFDEPVARFLERKADTAWDHPLTAPLGAAHDQLLSLMNVRLVRHLPLVDEDGRLVGLALKSELEADRELPVSAVVMAGGYGARLKPMTDAAPKPMLKVGDKPMIEHIVGQLRDSGIREVCVTTHYRAEQIREHLGDGSGHGVDVRYTFEEKPLGTVGALAMLVGTQRPLLVVNGDVLTEVDYRAMLSFHREQGAELTVGVRRHAVPVPFGVVEAEGTRVRGIVEKEATIFINAGIYLLEPTVLDHIPSGERTDMTEVIAKLVAAGAVVVSFPIHEDWIDVGTVEDFARAGVARGGLMGLSGRSVVVTGADGFIGSHLAERLVAEGARVKALVWYNAFGRAGWLDDSEVRDEIEIVAGDVTDAESTRDTVAGADVVFHLAALIAIPYSYAAPRSYLRTNAEGTLNVLQAARDAGVSRVVHTSTSEVYGTGRQVPISEDHPLQGQSP